MEKEHYHRLQICNQCSFSKTCRLYDYKNPITKKRFPIFSKPVNMMLERHRFIKIGGELTIDDFDKISNKEYELLEVFTAREKEKEIEAMKASRPKTK